VGLKVDGPDALNLARAAGGEGGCFVDGVAADAQCDDSLVGRNVGGTAGVFSRRLGKLAL